MKIARILIGVCAGTLLLSGCMTEEPITQRATEERIELVEGSSFKIELLDAKTLVNDDGLLTVDASVLLSRTNPFRWFFVGDPQITIWYHFDWIDSKGNIRPPVQHEMVAMPGNIVSFHGVAPEEKYINYRLTISLKGPATKEETAKQQDNVKKQVKESGKVKPAGKSQAKKSKKSKSAKKKAKEKKAQPAPADKKAEPAKAAQPAPADKKAEPAKAQPAPADKKAGTGKQQKLTEPFD